MDAGEGRYYLQLCTQLWAHQAQVANSKPGQAGPWMKNIGLQQKQEMMERDLWEGGVDDG